MAGMVSERDIESSISDWQETAALEFSASFVTTTDERNVLIPPSLEIDFVLIYELVSGAA
jgi:hypothetical protein